MLARGRADPIGAMHRKGLHKEKHRTPVVALEKGLHTLVRGSETSVEFLEPLEALLHAKEL